ncbi:S8 family serine peptidase [Planobispora longispora]|uniref:Type VII secretion-associated serine protease n=1 Tax=Planobispora longispora TaxID=28887 RepID=A0A8J3RM09_9ACTN|nr:S8 family serine peptidase [Planobispora longispora]GIH77438.1 type VII secretion-associated serine protease [Planobispora longispora]
MLRRRGRRRAGAAVALAAVISALCAAVAAPAGAADIREDQRWVLEALNAPEAWKVTKGAGVTVALVDDGVDDRVAELRGKVVSGPSMGSIAEGGRESATGEHGTAMASLIAGAGKGDGGLLGIAPEARILSLPLKFTEDEEGDAIPPESDQRTRRDSPVARAIRYAVDHGAQVISMSLGAYGPNRAEREAVSHALSKGVVLIAAAGNGGESEYATANATSFWNFPAGYSGVIGVGASDREGRPAPFSSGNLSVLVSAPGVEVPVVTPGGEYDLSDGTSSATALVAGAATLIKAKYPDIPPHLVARALSSTARFATKAGYDEHIGFGVVDAAAALDRAGELLSAAAPVPVAEGRRFGGGPLPEGPDRPGPDPFRLWLYGTGLIVGVLTFTGTVVVLTRKTGSGSRL